MQPEKKPYRFRLAQRHSPFLVGPPDQKTRPFLTLLIDETRHLVLSQNITEHQQNHEEIAAWLDNALLNPNPSIGPAVWPETLLIEDRLLQKALQRHFRTQDLDVVFDADASDIDTILTSMEEGLQGERGPGLVETVGEETAIQLFRAAQQFADDEPWDSLGNEEVIELSRPQGRAPMALLVLGSGGEEYGLVLYKDVDAAARSIKGYSIRCSAAAIYSSADVLHPDDLKLFESLGYEVEDEFYPWILGDSLTQSPLSAEYAKDLIWTLENVPHFAETRKPFKGDGYGLRKVKLPAGDFPELVAIAEPWLKDGKLGPKARDMGRYFLLFLEHLEGVDHCRPQSIAKHRKQCQIFGRFLINSRLKFEPEQFLESPPERSHFGTALIASDADWKAFRATWTKLGEFHSQRFPSAD
jgi:hypothetical protein